MIFREFSGKYYVNKKRYLVQIYLAILVTWFDWSMTLIVFQMELSVVNLSLIKNSIKRTLITIADIWWNISNPHFRVF